MSIDSDRASRLADALTAQPRLELGHFPTPLEEAPRLSARLGFRLLVKRDDATGLALGGNKVRKLEFLLAEARQRGADYIITTGGSQSNHARLTAAACRRIGMDCLLVLDRGVHPEDQGNLLLDRLFGAKILLIESTDQSVALARMHEVARDLEAGGHRPYVIPRGGSVPTGATGYALCALELQRQLEDGGLEPTHIYLGTGSTGTHSGFLAGVTALGWDVRVEGISVSRSRQEQVEKVLNLSNATLERLGLDTSVSEEAIHIDDRYVGEGYGHPTAATMEAIELAALDESLILDPVYTGKALSGLIDHAREGRIRDSSTVVFLHTGGTPALFAYHAETAAAIASVSA